MDRIEIYPSRRGLVHRKQWRWRFVATNGKRIATSGEAYTNRHDLVTALSRVIGVPSADLLELVVTPRHSKTLHRAGRVVHVVVLDGR